VQLLLLPAPYVPLLQVLPPHVPAALQVAGTATTSGPATAPPQVAHAATNTAVLFG
jgi:hypothetical protein